MHGSSWEQGSAGPSGESCLDTPALCGAHHFPQPCPGTAGASWLCEGSGAALPLPGLALGHHGVRSCWPRVQGLLTARWDGDKDLMLPGQAVGSICSTTLWSWEGGYPPPSPRHQHFLLLVTSAFSCFSWCRDGITPLLCTPLPQGLPALLHHTATAQGSRHSPGTAQALPVGHRDGWQSPGQCPSTGTLPLSLQGPARPGPRLTKHTRRGLHRSDGQHSPLAPFETMGSSSSDCSES